MVIGWLARCRAGDVRTLFPGNKQRIQKAAVMQCRVRMATRGSIDGYAPALAAFVACPR
jgi:hypothetical protein